MSRRIADVYAPEIMAEFRQRHAVTVGGNVTWKWACTCGKGSKTGTTQGRASAGSQRHLRAEHRKFIRELEEEPAITTPAQPNAADVSEPVPEPEYCPFCGGSGGHGTWVCETCQGCGYADCRCWSPRSSDVVDDASPRSIFDPNRSV